ncbi:putative RNA methyltransferase [Shewanella sp.]|uniref:putative RNA methyltransferase n=1 Tax=Shewanella sp. TaxID=50422 RepID=UPI0035632834
MQFQCPLCRQPLHAHQESKGWYCDGKHHFDRHAIGYWDFFPARKPKNAESRDTLRARQFLLTSGIYGVAIEALARVVGQFSATGELQCIQQGAGNAWLGKQLKAVLDELGTQVQLFSPLEAENEAFAAAKAGMEGVCFTSLKGLPFADASADMLWLLEAPLKGKEWLRVLKPDGLLLMLVPGPRHLWQLREFVYPGLEEKSFTLELPSTLEILEQQPVSWSLSIPSQDALVLMDMAPWAWRVKESVRKSIAKTNFDALEMDFRIIVARKKA